MTTSEWPEAAVEILRGDVVAGFAATTRFGSVSLAPVCPIGMVDVDAGTVATSVPLAFSDKLRRLAEAPQASLAFFRREHGQSSRPGFVLVQGDVSFPDAVPASHLGYLRQNGPKYLGSMSPGPVLRRLGGAPYYEQRLPVTLHVRRLLHWQDDAATSDAVVVGEPLPDSPTEPQRPPVAGTDPAVPATKFARQLRRGNDHLIGFVGTDGLPTVLPIHPEVDRDRVRFYRPDPPTGGRRAGLMGFWYNARLHGQGALMCRGWMDATERGATFAASSCQKFNTPPGAFVQEKVLPVALGFMYRKAVRTGAVRDGAFVRPG